ncbi:MAG: hypothetical protein ABW212_18955 [Pseudonocardia sediminis]
MITRGLEQVGTAAMSGLADEAGPCDGPARPGPAGPGEAGGPPVVLVGGFATTAPLLGPMSRWLHGLGHDVTPFVIGSGFDCAQRTVDLLGDEVRAVSERAGRPVQLIGHSRGGQFARATAARIPGHVSGLVTLGSPFDLFGLRAHTLFAAAALAAAGTVGMTGFASLSCLTGACCREFRAVLRLPVPAEVPFTSIYSDDDRVVPSRSSIDPSAHNVRVDGSHLDMLTGPHARPAIERALALGRSTRRAGSASHGRGARRLG